MHPIFKEYINFLKSKTNELEFLQEGVYWYDKSIIKAFDKDGNLHKIARIYIDDNLEVSIKKYKQNIIPENWNETIKRLNNTLCRLEAESLDLIKNNINISENKYILISGGKDSSVTEYLVKKIDSNIKIIFNNSTLDCADTYKFIKSKDDVIILNPKKGFYQWRKENNFIPTRFARACCSIFKESVMIDYLDKNKDYLFFMGMRNQESSTRSNYKDIWKNKSWGNRNWVSVLPIRKWSELEIWLYILKNNIPINTKYKKGYSRVGCAIACPYYTKSTWILDKYWYPKMYKRWHNILIEDFKNNNKDIVLNCTEKEYHICWNGGRLRENPSEQVIKEFANRNNLDLKMAKKYFNHNCQICNKKIKDKYTIAMNIKLQGENIALDRYLCKKHLKEKFDISEEQYNRIIELYQIQDCPLF